MLQNYVRSILYQWGLSTKHGYITKMKKYKTKNGEDRMCAKSYGNMTINDHLWWCYGYGWSGTTTYYHHHNNHNQFYDVLLALLLLCYHYFITSIYIYVCICVYIYIYYVYIYMYLLYMHILRALHNFRMALKWKNPQLFIRFGHRGFFNVGCLERLPSFPFPQDNWRHQLMG